MSEEHQIDYDSVGTIEAHVAVAPPELSIGLDEALEKARAALQAVQEQYDNKAIEEAAEALPDIAIEIGKESK